MRARTGPDRHLPTAGRARCSPDDPQSITIDMPPGIKNRGIPQYRDLENASEGFCPFLSRSALLFFGTFFLEDPSISGKEPFLLTGKPIFLSWGAPLRFLHEKQVTGHEALERDTPPRGVSLNHPDRVAGEVDDNRLFAIRSRDISCFSWPRAGRQLDLLHVAVAIDSRPYEVEAEPPRRNIRESPITATAATHLSRSSFRAGPTCATIVLNDSRIDMTRRLRKLCRNAEGRPCFNRDLPVNDWKNNGAKYLQDVRQHYGPVFDGRILGL